MSSRLPDTRKLSADNIVQYVQSLVRGVESVFNKLFDDIYQATEDIDAVETDVTALEARFSTGTFTPEFLFVTAPTYSTQTGKYWTQDDLLFFLVILEYTGLDTADSSSIVIGGFSPIPRETGVGVAQIALNESSGLTFAATDAVHASFRAGFDQVILTNSANTGYAYNSGKIAASGKLVLQGWYQYVL